MVETKGYSGKVTKIKGNHVWFHNGGVHYISNSIFAINLGDVIMVDSHGAVWKKI